MHTGMQIFTVGVYVYVIEKNVQTYLHILTHLQSQQESTWTRNKCALKLMDVTLEIFLHVFTADSIEYELA